MLVSVAAPAPLLAFPTDIMNELVVKVKGENLRPVLPRVSFSPESGGRVKPSRAMLEMRTQGTIRLKK